MKKVQAFLHLEIVHPDPHGAAQFICDTLDGEIVERSISSFVENTFEGVGCAHVRIGNVVLQFIRPTAELPTWKTQLETQGPGVHNISIGVSDMDGVREALTARGCKEIAKYSIDPTKLGLPGNAPIDSYIFDAFEQAGVRIEMVPV